MPTDPASPAPAGQGAEGADPNPASSGADPNPQGAASTPDPNAPPPDPASPPAPSEPFLKTLKNEDLRGYAELKGFKGDDPVTFAETVLESYRNLERLRGVPAERLLTLPENMDDAEAMKPIYERLGFAPPAKPEDYGFVTTENADPEQAQAMAALAHKHGVPLKMAQAVFADIAAMEAQGREALMAEAQQETAVELAALKSEWKGDYDANVEAAKRAVRAFGATEEQLQAIEESIGAAALYRIFHNAGQRLGEAPAIQGDTPKTQFAMSPEAARTRISELQSNREWASKWMDGDAAAKAEWDRLHKIAYGSNAA